MGLSTPDPRKRNWTFLVYPDSAPENWLDILAEQNLPAYVSPLHDKDVNPDGTPKKAHYHVVLQFRGKKMESAVQEISDLFSGVKVQAVNDMRSICRYLCHLDNPEKAQYSRDEVRTFGGLDYVEMIESAADIDNVLREIMEWCREQGCDSFASLSDYAAKEKPAWFRVITTKRSNFLMAYLKSKAWTDLQQQKLAERNRGKSDKTHWSSERKSYKKCKSTFTDQAFEINELLANHPDSEEPI